MLKPKNRNESKIRNPIIHTHTHIHLHLCMGLWVHTAQEYRIEWNNARIWSQIIERKLNDLIHSSSTHACCHILLHFHPISKARRYGMSKSKHFCTLSFRSHWKFILNYTICVCCNAMTQVPPSSCLLIIRFDFQNVVFQGAF